jgi:hypothetical protein
MISICEIYLKNKRGEDKFGMSRDQDAGRSHFIQTYYSSFERVEDFKHFETKLTNQNSIKEDMLL